MHIEKQFIAKIVGKGGLIDISLMLESDDLGYFSVKLSDLNLSEEEKDAVLNADSLEGTVHYDEMVRENSGVLKVLNLKPANAPEKTKSLSKEFNGKIVMELDDMSFTMVVETETLGTLHIPTKQLNLVFEQYQAMREKGVVGTYEIEDDANDMNTKKIKVTGLKPKK